MREIRTDKGSFGTRWLGSGRIFQKFRKKVSFSVSISTSTTLSTTLGQADAMELYVPSNRSSFVQ